MTKKTDLSGFSKLAERTEKGKDRVAVRLSDLLTPAFIRLHSEFETLEQFFDAIGVSSEDLERVKVGEFDALIAAQSSFDGWRSMFEAATAGYYARQSGLE